MEMMGRSMMMLWRREEDDVVGRWLVAGCSVDFFFSFTGSKIKQNREGSPRCGNLSVAAHISTD